ncbi:hypothetical protein N6H18_09505 [Reichenbachiella agarivorans]|uniref:Uncharacterized protein n=1 Tax=Reichenbachiella agarivorans TaxID=2979464 RepID=A0ABY6CJM3_9BACT|nr:hypothetical protein [Reichenbachiella agarivorans]UXP30589.1 hypothetical protein N6H18_09505 [Reichenbachiella agarivorans]
MKKLLSLLMMAGIMISMISCSEDDGGSTDGDGDGEGTAGTVIVEANISGEETWTSDNVYELAGRITVLDGAVLTIEPGTIIKGQAGTGANATVLLVARGGKLMATGTATAPIIFTSVADEITPEDIAAGNFYSNLDPDINGLWGGVIVLGKAPISAANANKEDISETVIEGIPSTDTNGIYGGSDAADDSGELHYISIRHGGSLIGAGNEINGLTLGGVGSGTSISNIEVVANQDDGVEVFGGDVSLTNVLVWNSSDDALDTDQDWSGSITNFIIIDPKNGGSAFELDGPEGSAASTRGVCHTFENGTVYASVEEGFESLVDWDSNTNAEVKSIYFFGMPASYTDKIASYNGNGCGTSDNWEATLADGVDAADVFGDAEVTVVAKNANTVGADASAFGWTWAAKSGKLAEIGL